MIANKDGPTFLNPVLVMGIVLGIYVMDGHRRLARELAVEFSQTEIPTDYLLAYIRVSFLHM